MKQWLKRSAVRYFPRTTARILSARSRRANQKFVRKIRSAALTRRLLDRFGPTVQSGPFAGMILTSPTHAEHLGPYLLGTYEGELHSIWERIRSRRFPQVIDVGAKFGYYAIGLARLFPTSSVMAFDTDPWARAVVADMAIANSTPNVSSQGFCSPDWFEDNLLDHFLIVSDCEGYETELFSTVTPALTSAMIIVEAHDFLIAGTTDRLLARFADSHRVETISTRPARPPDGIDLSFLDDGERMLAVNELRPAQQWLVFTPRGGT